MFRESFTVVSKFFCYFLNVERKVTLNTYYFKKNVISVRILYNSFVLAILYMYSLHTYLQKFVPRRKYKKIPTPVVAIM